MAERRWEQDAWVDAEVQRADPIRGSLDGAAFGSSLDETGNEILRFVVREHPRRARVLRVPRRLVLIGVLVLGASGAAAAASGVFVNANTHTYAHRGDFRHGQGPGEFLNLAGTNLVQVVKKDSAGAGITFPAGRFDWRSSVIKRIGLIARSAKCPSGSPRGCKVEESTGSIDVNIAQAAFGAWVLLWRRAEMTHDPVLTREAAAVIAKAPTWKAIADDRVSTLYEEDFSWIRPFVHAVATGDLSRVNQLIAKQTGAPIWLNDPDGFAVWFAKYASLRNDLPYERRMARQEGTYYLRYLSRHGS
jgi:hypothetical protein